MQDSLVIDTGLPGEQGQLLLFLRLSEGAELDEGLEGRVKARLRRLLSPRHSPGPDLRHTRGAEDAQR